MKCPSCGGQIDAHINRHGKKQEPRKGNVLICFYCRDVFLADPPGVRAPTNEELVGITQMPGFIPAVKALEEMHRRNPELMRDRE